MKNNEQTLYDVFGVESISRDEFSALIKLIFDAVKPIIEKTLIGKNIPASDYLKFIEIFCLILAHGGTKTRDGERTNRALVSSYMAMLSVQAAEFFDKLYKEELPHDNKNKHRRNK